MESVKENKAQETLNKIKILIADDDPPTRLLLRAAIAQWGYEVIEASDGEQAWSILQEQNPPDLLLLDWIMPKLDGPSLCERIKKELSFSPYIILLTQVSGTTNIIKGLEAGADEFLSKPFNMAELRSRLSVGARLVNYKNQLDKQNNQMASLSQETEEKISELNNLMQGKKLEDEQSKKLLDVQNLLKKWIELLKAISIFRK